MANGPVVLGGLSQAIINPQIADVTGAIQKRQQHQLVLQQSADKKRANQLAADLILGNRNAAGLAELGGLDSKRLEEVQRAIGVPVGQEGRTKHFFGSAQKALIANEAGGSESALQVLKEEQAFLQRFQVDSPRLDNLINTWEQNPVAGAESLGAFVQGARSAGILKAPPTTKLGRDQVLVDVTGKVLAENITALQQNFTTDQFRSVNNDLTKFIDDSLKVRSSAKVLEKLGKTATSSDQFAAIITFIKTLDPTSVVSQTEGKSLVASGGLSDVFLGDLQRLAGKGQLTGTAFQKLVDTARNLANARVSEANVNATSFLDSFGNRIPEKDRKNLLTRLPEQLTGPIGPPGTTGPKFLGFE